MKVVIDVVVFVVKTITVAFAVIVVGMTLLDDAVNTYKTFLQNMYKR